MATRNSSPKPFVAPHHWSIIKARPALRDNLAQLTKTVFVAGGEDVPQVETKVIPIQRTINGQKSFHYEVRLEVRGVRLANAPSPPPVRGEASRNASHQSDSASTTIFWLPLYRIILQSILAPNV